MDARHLSQAISVATLRSGVMQEVVRFLNTHPLLHDNGIAFKIIEFKEPSEFSLQLSVDSKYKELAGFARLVAVLKKPVVAAGQCDAANPAAGQGDAADPAAGQGDAADL